MFQPALCNGYGPGTDMFDDTRIIGEYQFNTAKVNIHFKYKLEYYHHF